MRARLTTLCAGLMFLCACQVQVGTTVKKGTASPHPGSPEPVASGSVAPSSPGTGTPSPGTPASASPAAAAPPEFLKPPPGSNSLLKGVARLDANYIVAAGAGNIISGNAGAIIGGNASAIVAAGGGNIIGGNGSAAIANASGQIVASGAGNIISGNGGAIIGGNGSAIVASGGGNIVASGAGNIVASGAGNIVAAGGGNIVAAGGGNIVAAGAGNRRLLAVDDGARVPVAGMPLTVISLATHQPVPVGVDKAGKPVYTVYTNANGGFELYLPEAEKGNVLVLAQVKPDAADPRLAYGFVAEPGTGQEVSLDEDQATLSTYLRRGLGPFLGQALAEPDSQKIVKKFLGTNAISDDVRNIMIKQYQDIYAAGQQVGANTAPEAEVKELVQRIVDRLAHRLYTGTDPAKSPIMLLPSNSGNDWQGPTEPALYAMLDIMRLSRQATRAKLAKDPNYFNKTDYVETVNRLRDAEHLGRYNIVKDTDLNNMMVAEYFQETDDQRWALKGACHDGAHYLFGMLGWIFEDIGMQKVSYVLSPTFKSFDDPTVPYTNARFGQSDRADQAYYAILTRGFMMMAGFFQEGDGPSLHDEVFQMISEFKPSGKARTSPTPLPSVALPCGTPVASSN